jgi:uncharacterized protein
VKPASPRPQPAPPSQSREPRCCWVLCDGKPGHENQSLGLAEALARATPFTIHRISLPPAAGPLARLRHAQSAAASLPAPDFILAAGHRTHLALWRLSRRYRARSVVLMRPSLPRRLFDCCVAPRHDFPHLPPDAAPPGLLLTRGALNRIPPPGSAPHTEKLILLGGPSAHHGWDEPSMLAMLQDITRHQPGWILTDSRRTPPEFTQTLSAQLPGVEIHPHATTSPDWLPSRLAAAAEVWVSEDSVSMVYEALSSGARVGLLPVPRTNPRARILQGLHELIDSGYLTPYANWQSQRQLPHAPQTLREADRIAAALLPFPHGSP